MRDKVYLNLPNQRELAQVLLNEFQISPSITGADIIITEEAFDYINNKLILLISPTLPEDDQNCVLLSPNLPQNVLTEAIKTSIATYNIVKGGDRFSSVYKVLDGQDPKVEYFINKFENMLNAAPESIIEVDATGTILFHNVKFSQVYDPESQVIDGNIFDIFDKETSDNLKNYMSWELADKNSEFIGKLVKKNGVSINIAGHITALQDDNYHFEIIFDDITSKIAKLQKLKKIEEQSIVAGLSRHLSHNVMNALTTAGGFIRQVKAKTENNLHTQNLWRIIDEKLLLIEEVVAGYNDYTHAVNLITSEKIELFEFFKTLIQDIAEKRLERNFSAYLYKFTDFYNLTYDFSKGDTFVNRANKMFLKLAVCYILKDCVRYFGGNVLDCAVSLKKVGEEFAVAISIKGVDIPDHIVSTMFRPWDHQMLTQSFDYWGIVIAGSIMEKHNGKVEITKTEAGLTFTLKFFAPC